MKSFATETRILSRRAVAAILAAWAVVPCFAESPDSTLILPSTPPKLEADTSSTPSFMRQADAPESSLPATLGLPQVRPLQYEGYRYNSLSVNNPLKNPTIASWSGGYIAPIGSRTEMLGLANVDHGALQITQAFGPLTLNAWGGATKVGYFRGLQTSYGFGFEANYAITDRWSITAFGSHYTPMHPLTPAMAGFMPTSNYGIYASHDFNDHWGLSLGAQTVRSLANGRWETMPIVKPYYKVNKKVSIGIDVGSIVYNMAKDYIDSRRYRDHQSAPGPVSTHPPRPQLAPRR